MIDPQLLRQNPDLVRQSQRDRFASTEPVDQALEADRARREAIAEFEQLRSEQNQFNATVSKALGEEKQALIAQLKELSAKVKDANDRAQSAQDDYEKAVSEIQNIVHPDVPVGQEADFRVIREVNKKPEFDFTPKDHVELSEIHDLIDLARGAKVSGSRFYFLKGLGARLELALMNLGLDRAIAAGFTPMLTPTLVRPEIMQGTGFLGDHSDEIYHLPADNLYLTGTSEVALAGYHADEILDIDAGALRYAGWSTCYRREAGAHGKDTRGILRVHQFNKLEMFSYTSMEEAEAEHERLLAWQEDMLQACELHYRVIDVATGDLGASAARKFDCEAWVPTQDTFRELTSTSNCTSFQSRRLGIRHRGADGKTTPVATLNGTLATTRWLVAILETHQQADGSIRIPKALQPYMGGLSVISA